MEIVLQRDGALELNLHPTARDREAHGTKTIVSRLLRAARGGQDGECRGDEKDTDVHRLLPSISIDRRGLRFVF
jgi:hypothetical protein